MAQSKSAALLAEIRKAPSSPPQPSPKLEDVIASRPRIPSAPAAARAALPNIEPAGACTQNVSLYGTDFAHLDLIEQRIRALGYRRVSSSLVMQVALRVAAADLAENPNLPLGKWVEEAQSEDRRRAARRRAG